MAKILYALSGQGRGHTSRVLATSDELRRRGHEIVFCCGGTARDILESQGERVIPVPALRQMLEGNEIRHLRTLRYNFKYFWRRHAITRDLAERFAGEKADLLITDFEAFSPRAAERIGLPVLSFNHQQVVTETQYEMPPACLLDALVTTNAIEYIAPRRPEHILITSFYFPPLKRPGAATIVAPIIRPAVEALEPRKGEHVLVYYNQTEGADHVLDVLRRVNAEFVLYNFGEPGPDARYPNIRFKAPSLDEFLRDLATSRGVLCTAGFTLMSECIFLGKPLMVVPNRGIFEQTLNALFLEREGLGQAVLGRRLQRRDVETFLQAEETYAARLQGRRASGNLDAVRCIETVLRRLGARPYAVPAHTARSGSFPQAETVQDT